MTIAVPPPPSTDLLARAVEDVRPHLNSTFPIGQRIRNFWAGVVVSRELAAADLVEAEFMRLAQETGLAPNLGRHADEDLRHVVRWAILNKEPFGRL